MACRPASVFRSRIMARLPWLTSMPNHIVANGPAWGAGGSTRITSAPNSASVRPAAGPAMMLEKSSTLMPSSRFFSEDAAVDVIAADRKPPSACSVSRWRSAGEAWASPSKLTKRPACRTGPSSASSRSAVTPASCRPGSVSHSVVVRTTVAGTFASRRRCSQSAAGADFIAAAISWRRCVRHSIVSPAALYRFLPLLPWT